MVVFDLKKRFIISLILLTLSLSLFVFATWGWFTQLIVEEDTYNIGFVNIEVDPYFWVCEGEPELCTEIDAQFVPISITPFAEKTGVYLIVIDTNNSDYFFENFRLRLIVNSSVDTYFRIRIYEQLTLRYENAGVATELSILNNEYMPFDYDLTNWHDQRDLDNYLYYKFPVKRISASQPDIINLIPDYTLSPFPIYDANYSLQIAFTLEAVQAFGGPENEWGQEAPPWDFYGNLVERGNPSLIEVEAERIFASHASLHKHLNSLIYFGVDGHLYDYSGVVEYTYISSTDTFLKDGISHELDINGNLVLVSAPSVIIVEAAKIFGSMTLLSAYQDGLFYTNIGGSLLNLSDTIIYTKNTETNIYTDGTIEYIMDIITE